MSRKAKKPPEPGQAPALPSPYLRWSAVGLLLAAFAFRVLGGIRAQSATYDEAYFIGFGYATLKTGDFRLRKDKSVLSAYLVGAPLLGSGAAFSPHDPDWRRADSSRVETQAGRQPIWNFGLNFLYKNLIPADAILLRARLAPLCVGLWLGLLVHLLARRLYGEWAGLCALAFYALCPNMLAHAGLATEDLILTAFFFASVFALLRLIEEPGLLRGAAFGLALAAALLSKYTAVLLLPVCGVLLVAAGAWRPAWWAARWKPFAAAAVSLAAAFLVAYRFTHLPEYFRGFSAARAYIQGSQMAFLHGHYSLRGFWDYYLAAFFLKTPLPLLAAAAPLLLSPRRLREWRHLALVLPVAALLLAASLTPMQIGHRHILPLYPFLFVLAGGLAAVPWWRHALWLVIPWLAVESALAHPHYLAYFNELAGGPSGGWRWLVDANMDWGQDLKGLRRYVRERGSGEVVLSYYGAGLPEAVGFEFQDLYSFGLWGKKDHVNSLDPERELLAVSVTNLQGVYLTPVLGLDGLAWLKKREPQAKIGWSIFVYDITRDAFAHEWLAHTYLLGGHLAQAGREAARALRLEPKSAWPRLISAFLALQSGRADEALRGFKTCAPGLRGLPWDEAIRTRSSQQVYSLGLTALAAQALGRGDLELARTGGALAAELDPGNAEAREVWARASGGQRAQARKD